MLKTVDEAYDFIGEWFAESATHASPSLAAYDFNTPRY